MSATRYYIDSVLNLVKGLVDASRVPRENQLLYTTFLQNLYNVPVEDQRSLQANMISYLEQRTNGAWRGGMHQQDIVATLKPWVVEALRFTESTLPVQPQYGNPQFNQPQGGSMSYVSPSVNPTSRIYGGGDVDTRQAQPLPPIQFQSDTTMNTSRAQEDTVVSDSAFFPGQNVEFFLQMTPTVEFSRTPKDKILYFQEYKTCDYKGERLLTTDIRILVSQNSTREVGLYVYENAPQEVIRGIYVTVVRYNELFHIPMGYKQFCAILKSVTDLKTEKPESTWRDVVRLLSKRSQEEWRSISSAFCRLYNPIIYRRFHTSSNATIGDIDSMDDLFTFDNRKCELTVVKDNAFLNHFLMLTELIFNTLFDQKALISPTDKHFGDFINCDDVIFYSDTDARSKYDYGTYAEKVDRDHFVENLLAENTVIRVPRTIVLTNALSPGLISRIRRRGPESQRVYFKEVNTVGTELLSRVDIFRNGCPDRVICMEKGSPPEQFLEQINIGRTLQGDLLFLR